MAETKKTAIAKPVAKAVAAKAADTKTEEAKTTQEAPVAAEAKKTTRKTTAKKTTAKKAPAKKAAAEKKTPAKRTAVKETVTVQFAGKDYTTEDLVNIAKDVWKYDLNQKVSDFKSVELYVKPEESLVYYVINGEVKGDFNI